MGILLAVEGAKGVGKTTLVTTLGKQLANTGKTNVVITKEPTSRFDLQRLISGGLHPSVYPGGVCRCWRP